MKKKRSKKDVIGKIITAFLSFCIIGGSTLKYIGNDASSVLLKIYNTYTAVCIIGLCLTILLLIFFSGYSNFINYPGFKKAYVTKAKVISSEKAAGASAACIKLTVGFTDIDGNIRQCEIITDNYKAAAGFIKRGKGKIRYKVEDNDVKAIIAKEYSSVGKAGFLTVILLMPLIFILIPMLTN